MDIRIARTDRAIEQAFMELREKNPLEKIKIKDLCAMACINKSTFYAHYEDIYALANLHNLRFVGLGNYIDLLSDDIVSDFDDKPDPDGCTDSNSPCTPAALFTRDLGVWKQNVANTLPLGQASIFVAPWDAGSTAASQIGIMVSWRANESADMTEDDLNNLDTTKVREGDEWISATGKDGVECPDGRICHLQYITVAARCARSQNDNKIYCPGSK